MNYTVSKYGVLQKGNKDIDCLYCRSTPMERQVWPCHDMCAAFEVFPTSKLEHGGQMPGRVLLHCCGRSIDIDAPTPSPAKTKEE